MSEHLPANKAELQKKMMESWNTLQIFLGQLSEAQLTGIKDKQGWSVKDHLGHMIAWERSALFFLQGKPRHEGLGIDEQTYLTGDDDVMNAMIQRQGIDVPLTTVMDAFRETHRQLVAVLQPLSDADLQKPYRHYLPNEPGEGDGPSAMHVIYGNTAGHYTQHLDWIKTLVAVA